LIALVEQVDDRTGLPGNFQAQVRVFDDLRQRGVAEESEKQK